MDYLAWSKETLQVSIKNESVLKKEKKEKSEHIK